MALVAIVIHLYKMIRKIFKLKRPPRTVRIHKYNSVDRWKLATPTMLNLVYVFHQKIISKKKLVFIIVTYLAELQSDTIKILWTFGEKDPVYGDLKWHGAHSGARSIHLISPLWKKPNFNHNNANRDIRQWDVAVKNVSTYIL